LQRKHDAEDGNKSHSDSEAVAFPSPGEAAVFQERVVPERIMLGQTKS
jgi:hypothetical protein